MISRLAEPMRAACGKLTEVVVQSGHWMAQEKPAGSVEAPAEAVTETAAVQKESA